MSQIRPLAAGVQDMHPLGGFTSAISGDAFQIGNCVSAGASTKNGTWHCKITGTATLKLQARNSEDYDWIDLVTYTASGGEEVTLWPHMRATVSSYTSGTVTCSLAC